LVDELAAVIAVEFPKGEEEVCIDVPEGGKSPAMGLVEEGIQANPAGSGSGEGEDIPA
jgi:hypothetical protein